MHVFLVGLNYFDGFVSKWCVFVERIPVKMAKTGHFYSCSTPLRLGPKSPRLGVELRLGETPSPRRTRGQVF